jgi:transcriptional regulator with XRE-family HTH domain
MVTPVNDDEGWDLVASRLAAEMSVRGLTLRAIEQATGVSYPTMQKLLAGERVTRRDRLVVLAQYFGWPGDAFDRIRRGEEPVDEIHIDASGVDLEELRQVDPESYDQIMSMARLALDRARDRRLGR